MPKKVTKAYRFSFVDFLIIVALAVAICALVYAIAGGDIKELTAEKVEAIYTLYIDNAYIDSFSVGDEIITKNGRSAGTITSIIGLYDNSDISMVIVSAEAYSVKKDLFINGQLLASNTSFSVALSDKSVINAFCASVITVI
jgi:hypothetical protein